MIPDIITIDFETKSYSDLLKVGAWAYSEHPTTDVIVLCYGIGHDTVQSWWPGKYETDDCPPYLAKQIAAGVPLEAHNVSFEIGIWYNIMVTRYDWPMVPLKQWRDLMAVACYYALPAKLDKLAYALNFPSKNPEGARLITKYSKLHLKTAKPNIPPEDFKKWIEYCTDDVLLEQGISDYLGDLPERELPLFQLDLEINFRGLLLDLDGIEAATEVVEKRKETLKAEFRAITGLNPTQRDKVMEWFRLQNYPLENMQGETIEEALEDDNLGQGRVRRALELVLKSNKASITKLLSMARQRGSDGRARFQSRYHGAGTGRNTGTGFQPLNLSRGYEKIPPDFLVRDIMYRDPDWLDACYGNALEAVGKSMRHWIMAAEGNKIIAGDFVSVEAVILACLAGEEWKIEAFRNKAKIYEMTADKIYKLPPGTVTKDTHPDKRQDGKVCELAFGYQGALGAWLNFDTSGRHTDEAIIGMCKSWRAEHPMIVRAWGGWEGAAVEAVEFAGRTTGYRDIGFQVVDDWLSMILPNGKRIWYFKPQLRMAMPAWHKPMEKEQCRNGTCNCEPKPQLTYMAQKFGQWKRVNTYGGKLAENATQATSREVLKPAEHRVTKYGYNIILSVYDEVVCEVPKAFGSKKEIEEIMAVSPGRWADNWPISVDAWEGSRYKK